MSLWGRVKGWFRKGVTEEDLVPPGDGPYRTPGRIVEKKPNRPGDKWMAVCHREVDGERNEYVLGIIQGPEDVAMDKAQEMMMNYFFSNGGFGEVLFGGYGLVPMSEEEFEEAKRKIKGRDK